MPSRTRNPIQMQLDSPAIFALADLDVTDEFHVAQFPSHCNISQPLHVRAFDGGDLDEYVAMLDVEVRQRDP
jgi:hypothetical protein